MESVDWRAKLGAERFGSDFEYTHFFVRDAGRNGLLGYTEELTPHLVFSAYLQGIFPWYDESSGDPVLWWSPDPRFVLPVNEIRFPRSAVKFLKHSPYTYTIDAAFFRVIENCAHVYRAGQDGTWIGNRMIDIYCALHERGIAHSIEAWHGDELAGGLYGVLIGKVFCGESMFTRESNAGKSAFMLFVKAFEKCGGVLIDSQVYTENIARYGGRNISRSAFLRMESELLPQKLSGDLRKVFTEIAAETVYASRPRTESAS
ncbi:leucyl/phenylalanyl-tRNA--protein transferase [Treponema sp. Marseille-Q4132]|uniref:leucyl/phenylalanyl-tRNA--protein transferase n=1 Tax=Treponema sp. Marseille-Q4132 TaxID=2766701 RepID=UPI0016533F9C|nr:leucyl/phenylalanyl-tRNA--protein transferase [Treponema sp. Marseille-Q4132]QNL96717.1 leucyl/phenylalanyl-tRNA--protein transferase [Treponema sp. Marseille-Q4132]